VSQSPETGGANRSYQEGWKRLSDLIGQGRSFSGHEKNTCFLNLRDGRFADVSSVTGLDFDDDARAVVRCDWDFDGQVDFWVSNRTAPRVRFLQNMGQGGGNWMAFRLKGEQSNRDAIGAKVTLRIGDEIRVKTVKAGDGFLAQSSQWLHFGLGENEVAEVMVRWPGQKEESFGEVKAGRFYDVREGSGKTVLWDAPRVQISEGKLPVVEAENFMRTVFVGRIPLPKLEGISQAKGKPQLLTLWSKICPVCEEKFVELRAQAGAIEKSGLEIVPLNVDAFLGGQPEELPALLPFPGKAASREIVEALELFHHAFLELQKPLSLPASFLLDSKGKVAVIYQGEVPLEMILNDVRNLSPDRIAQREAAVPFRGRWASLPSEPQVERYGKAFAKAGKPELERQYLAEALEASAHPEAVRLRLANLFMEERMFDEAVDVLSPLLEGGREVAVVNREAGLSLLRRGVVVYAAAHLKAALPFFKEDASLHYNLGLALAAGKKVDEALLSFRESLRLSPNNPGTHFQLGNLLRQDDPKQALVFYRNALRLRPGWSSAVQKLALLLSTSKDESLRDGEEASRLIGALVQKDGGRNIASLKVLAASLAELGDFDGAVQVIKRALALATKKGEISELEKVRVQYQKKQATRE
jgi:tetratricopeptide (TPR) repeat protein